MCRLLNGLKSSLRLRFVLLVSLLCKISFCKNERDILDDCSEYFSDMLENK